MKKHLESIDTIDIQEKHQEVVASPQQAEHTASAESLQKAKEAAFQEQHNKKAQLQKQLNEEMEEKKPSVKALAQNHETPSCASEKRKSNIRKRLKKLFSLKGSWWRSKKKSHEKGSRYENLVVQKDFDLCKILYKMNLKNGNMAEAQMALKAMKNTALTQEQKDTYEAYANNAVRSQS